MLHEVDWKTEKLSELKDMVLWLKEIGAKSFTIDDLSVEFFDPPKPAPVADAPIEEPAKTPDEVAEYLDEMLFASAGY